MRLRRYLYKFGDKNQDRSDSPNKKNSDELRDVKYLKVLILIIFEFDLVFEAKSQRKIT